MAIRKVLIPMAGGRAGEAALVTGLMVARHWDASLTALHVRADSRDVAHLAAEGLSGAMLEEMMNATERESGRRAESVRAVFERVVTASGVPVGPAVAGQRAASAELRTVTGRPDDRIAQLARLADLTVVPHPEAEEDLASEALNAVLFDSGRPVLISPIASPARLGARICLAWSGTAESAAAARFAIPWMRRATSVTLLSAKEYQRRGPAPAELAEYLALHGVSVSQVVFTPVDRDVGAGMLAAVQAAGADMLVMGAYSSSRLRQMILGGVTRHVLQHATLPVLMCR